MDTKRALTRRNAMGLMVIGGLGGLGASLSACKKELACTDTAGLTPGDAQMRTNQEYSDRSRVPGKQCDNCQLYKAAGPEQCGSCNVLKGPINPKGYCKLWVVKAG